MIIQTNGDEKFYLRRLTLIRIWTFYSNDCRILVIINCDYEFRANAVDHTGVASNKLHLSVTRRNEIKRILTNG